MIKIILLCFLFSLNLFANEEAIKKHIPIGYTYIKKMVDFNNDGKLDIVLELENLENKKRKLKILEQLNKNNYRVFFSSDKVLSLLSETTPYFYDIFVAKVNKENFVLRESIPGKVFLEYFFKLNKSNYVLEKVLKANYSSCNVDEPIFYYEIKDIRPKVYLKDFSLDYFRKEYYEKQRLIDTFKRVVETNFHSKHKKLLNLYKKNLKKFSKEMKSMILYNYNKDTNCLPSEYLNRYLYLKYPKTINKSNDIAFFFEQAGAYQEAIYLLEKIIEKYPNRTVAYINLGDSYLKDGNKEKAIENYKIYVKQMKDKNKEKKIPKRVLKEINSTELKTTPKVKQNTSKKESIKKEEKTFFTKLLELFDSSLPHKSIMQS